MELDRPAGRLGLVGMSPLRHAHAWAWDIWVPPAPPRPVASRPFLPSLPGRPDFRVGLGRARRSAPHPTAARRPAAAHRRPAPADATMIRQSAGHQNIPRLPSPPRILLAARDSLLPSPPLPSLPPLPPPSRPARLERTGGEGLGRAHGAAALTLAAAPTSPDALSPPLFLFLSCE